MPKPTVVYDDICLFCVNTKKKVDALGGKKRISWIGISTFDHTAFSLKKADLYKEIHLIQGDEVFKGYYAIKQIFRRMPLLFVFYMIMLIPGVDWIGKKVYSWIARHRYDL